MTKPYQFLLYIQFFISIYMNHCLVGAEPLIGEKVSPAKNGEFPSVVSLAKAPGTNADNHFCTGTLITKRHVLTAAHCLEVTNKSESFMRPSGILVTVGSINVIQGTKYYVQEWKDFEKWAAEEYITINHEMLHDIAVITLTDDVIEDIKPAHLSTLNYKSVNGKNVIAAGWGITNFNIRPRYLQRADLLVINRKTCLRNLYATNTAPELAVNHFCTIARPPISLGCGDSGGPIFVNGDEIIGVSSSDCESHDHPNQQNLHVAVKFYRKFIKAIIDPKSSGKKLANEVYSLDEFYNEE